MHPALQLRVGWPTILNSWAGNHCVSEDTEHLPTSLTPTAKKVYCRKFCPLLATVLPYQRDNRLCQWSFKCA